jgi:dihydrofolate reductase
MARLVFGMNQSLDGFVDHDHPDLLPDPVLFRHFIAEAEAQAGSLYGRKVYELMRYWDEDQPGWGSDEVAFAAAWRRQPKWVVSTTLASVGPHATLITGDLERAVRALKNEHEGEFEVAGPTLARALDTMGLIDEFRIYLRPAVPGEGKRYFAFARPPLRLISHERIGAHVVRLRYEPATR